jgi:hypothetical protein
MKNKRPYVAPEVFRVDLNPEQAILTACSLGTTSSIGNGNARCKPVQGGVPTGCKSSSAGSGGTSNSGARLS